MAVLAVLLGEVVERGSREQNAGKFSFLLCFAFGKVVEDEREIEIEGIGTWLIRIIIEFVMDIFETLDLCSFEVFLVVICMCLASTAT